MHVRGKRSERTLCIVLRSLPPNTIVSSVGLKLDAAGVCWPLPFSLRCDKAADLAAFPHLLQPNRR
jgi:hypothetical protein